MSSSLEQEIFDEMNLLRTDPPAYAAFVEERKGAYDGDVRKCPNVNLMTNEGVKAVEDCIARLKKEKPLDKLVDICEGMTAAAKKHVEDIGSTGAISHQSSDGTDFVARLEREGTWHSTCAENILVREETARDIVISFLVDDGNPTRGHYNNIMKNEMQCVGIATGPHKSNVNCCVIAFAGGWNEIAAKAPACGSVRRLSVSKIRPDLVAPPGGTKAVSVKTQTKDGKEYTITTVTITDADGKAKQYVDKHTEEEQIDS